MNYIGPIYTNMRLSAKIISKAHDGGLELTVNDQFRNPVTTIVDPNLSDQHNQNIRESGELNLEEASPLELGYYLSSLLIAFTAHSTIHLVDLYKLLRLRMEKL